MTEFQKKCPSCKTINGFSLDAETIKLDEEYPCEECGREFKLSKFK